MSRKTFSAEFKAEVALDALRGKETASRLAQRHGLDPSQVARWKAKAKRALVDVFRVGRENESGCPQTQGISSQEGKARGGLDNEELAALGRLAAGAVHEINNSLGILLCYAQLLLKDLPADDPIAQDLALMEKHAQQSRRIVEDLLRRARRGDVTTVVSTSPSRMEGGAAHDEITSPEP